MRVLMLAVILVLAGGMMQIQPASAGSEFKLRKIGECKRLSGSHDYTMIKDTWIFGTTMIETTGTNDDWDSRLFATDIKTCKRLWERELDCADTTGFAREGDRLYLINTQFTRDRTFGNPSTAKSEGGSPSIQCLDINTGKRIWIKSFRAGTTRISNPVIIGDLVYAGFGKIFYAFRKTDGKEVWSYSSNDHLMTTLKGDLNTNSEVYAFGGKSWAYWGNDYFSLHCLDAKTGKLKWKHDRVGRRKGYRPFEGVGLDAERIVDYAFDKSTIILRLIKDPKNNGFDIAYTIMALDWATGKILWEIDDFYEGFKNDFQNTLFSNSKLLFARHGETSETRIFDIKTGKLLRKINTTSALFPSTARNHVYNYKGVEAVRQPEGKRVWHRPIQLCSLDKANSVTNLQNIAEFDGILFLATEYGLFCIDSQSGKIMDSWKYKIQPTCICQTAARTIGCEIKNADKSNTVLLFDY